VESNSGPPRKYFSLTQKGAAFYKELESTWQELSNAVETITGENGLSTHITNSTSTNQ
jgi:PadR family transcriptional regulator PadR